MAGASWRAQPGPEGRVVPAGPSRAEGGQGRLGPGSALVLLAARGISQGPQAPGSAPLSSRSWGGGGFGETHPAGSGPSGPDRALEEKL